MPSNTPNFIGLGDLRIPKKDSPCPSSLNCALATIFLYRKVEELSSSPVSIGHVTLDNVTLGELL